MELTRILNLNPIEYEHFSDKQALDALESQTGLKMLVSKFYDLGLTQIIRMNFTGNSLRVTASSFPEIHALLVESCQILNVPIVPDMYIQRMDILEGMTLGADEPFIVLSTDAIERFSMAELRFVIGSHLGHIKSRHVLYLEIGHILPVLGEIIGDMTMGFGNLLSAGLQYALNYWERMAGFTADRAGLLACQDISAASSVLAKVSGLPQNYFDQFQLDDFVTQARAYQNFDQSNTNKVLKFFFGSKAWSVARANEFYKWTDSGQYQAVLTRRTTVAKKRFCPSCGREILANAAFCGICGTQIPPPLPSNQ